MYMMKLSIACRQNFRRWQHLLSANKMFNNKSYSSWKAKLIPDQIFGTDFMHTSPFKPNSNGTYASSRIYIYSLSLCTKVLMCVHIYSTQNISVNILLFRVLQFSRIFFDEFHITYNNHLNS